MILENVVLNVETEEIKDLSKAQSALEKLDITLKSDYEGFDENLKEKVTKGNAVVKYLSDKGNVSGSGPNKIEGEVVAISLCQRNEYVAPVIVTGLEGLASPYEVSYVPNGLSIVNTQSEPPIRYAISFQAKEETSNSGSEE